MDQTITGMKPVEGFDPIAGNRDLTIELVREFADDPIEVAELFDGTGQTFDPTEAVEFTTMRIVINT